MQFNEAKQKIGAFFGPIADVEHVPLTEACGRVLARDIFSKVDVPSYEKSQMDGYAVISKDLHSASESSPVSLRCIEDIDAGITPAKALCRNCCSYVATGAPIPAGADAVVMLEDTVRKGQTIIAHKSLVQWENIMTKGYDLKEGDIIAKENTKLIPRHIGAISGTGTTTVPVFKRPKVAVFSTGNEIILPGESPLYGMTYDVNAAFLEAQLKELGCEVCNFGIARDEYDDIAEKLSAAKGYDVILLSAGVSKGHKDHVYDAVSSLGTVHVHGINVKPGKPTLFATIGSAKVFGLPGHPTSCYTIFNLLVKPNICSMAGSTISPVVSRYPSTKQLSVPKGRMQFLPVSLSDSGATPLFRGSGAISSFLNADGFAVLDENTEYVDVGDELEVYMIGG